MGQQNFLVVYGTFIDCIVSCEPCLLPHAVVPLHSSANASLCAATNGMPTKKRGFFLPLISSRQVVFCLHSFYLVFDGDDRLGPSVGFLAPNPMVSPSMVSVGSGRGSSPRGSTRHFMLLTAICESCCVGELPPI